MRLIKECKLPKIKVTKEQLEHLFERDIIPVMTYHLIQDYIESALPFDDTLEVFFGGTRTQLHFLFLDFYVCLGKEEVITKLKDSLLDYIKDHLEENEDDLPISTYDTLSYLEDNLDDELESGLIEWCERQIKRNIFEPHFEIVEE